MQEPQSSASRSSSIFSSALAHSASILTPRRVGYTVAGVFMFAGAAAVMNGAAANPGTSANTKTQHFSVQTQSHTSGDTAAADGSQQSAAGSSSSTNFSADTSGGGTAHVQLNVNGQDIPVPTSGSTSQTIVNGNGSTTTVDVNGNTSTQGASSNQTSTHFSLDVHSSSSSSGGTTTSQ